MTHTALMLQLSSADGVNRQQLIALPNSVTFRRSITDGTRTRWRHGVVTEISEWTQGYVRLAAESDKAPLNLSHGCALIEVSDDEWAALNGKDFVADVQKRFGQVIDAMDADPGAWDVTGNNDVETWVAAWSKAVAEGDTDWLTARTHPQGTLSASTAPPPVTHAATPKPAVDTNPHGWHYEPIVDGFVKRPNGERYRVRALEGKTDVERLREARFYRDHVFLPGPPGTGKTALVEAAFGEDLVTMLGTEGTEVYDFVGNYVAAGKDDYVWQDGALAEAMDRGVPLFIDEGMVIDPRVMTVNYSVMDGRDELRITANPARGVVKAKPGFFVIIATNPNAPGVRISEALTSRCALTIEVTTDFGLMRDLGVDSEVVTVAESLQKRVDAENVPVYVPQARELLRFQAQSERYGRTVALRNLIAGADEDSRSEVVDTIRRTCGGAALAPLRL